MAADLPPSTPAAAPVAAIVAPAPAAAEPIFVDAHGFRYAINGNTLLPRAAIEAALRDAKTPKEAVDALDRAFSSAGYFLVVIGAQVNNKLVAIQVVQGRISEITAPPELARFLRRIEDRDNLTRRDVLQETVLLEFYLGRQGTRPRASFEKGAEVGGTNMTVTEEPIPGAKPWNAGLTFGNLGSRYSSRYTAAANASLRPGGGLELTAGYTQGIPGLTSDSAGSSYKAGVLGASVVTPWGLYSLSYSNTRYKLGEITAPLFPAGEIEQGGITGLQLAYADEATRVTLTQSLTRVSNHQDVYDGLADLTQQDYSVAAVGGTVNRSFALWGQNGSFNAGVTLSKGFSPRSGTFLPDLPGTPDPRFSLIQANASVTLGLPAGFSAAATVNGQRTDDTLPQNQQWVLGGFGNLSAWLPAVIVADSGALARATVTSPPWRWGEFSLSGAAFAEAGWGRFSYRPANDPYSRALADAGLSLSAFASTGTSATLAYAWPVWYRNVDGVERDVADRARANLYFTLSQSF